MVHLWRCWWPDCQGQAFTDAGTLTFHLLTVHGGSR